MTTPEEVKEMLKKATEAARDLSIEKQTEDGPVSKDKSDKIENVLEEYSNANLASKAARKRISKEILKRLSS